MTKHIKDFIRSCLSCQKRKHKQYTLKASLISIIAQHPFEIINVDVAGSLATTKRGHSYIIIAMDNFSKWVEMVASSNFTAETTAK